MSGKARWIVVPLMAATLAVSMATPALADKGGVPNQKSCGGIGSDGEGPSGTAFTCDDQGQNQASPKASCPGQGFPPFGCQE